MNIEPTAEDVGKMIWVRDDENGPWFLRRLCRIRAKSFGPVYDCERADGKPDYQVWAYAKRQPNPESQFPVVQPNPKPPTVEVRGPYQLMQIDPELMRGRCYTCRFWIDATKCEQVKGTENGYHVFNQECRECWAHHPIERRKTLAHELCAQWKPKSGLAYQPSAFQEAE